MDEEMKKALTIELEEFKKNLPEYATPEDVDAKLKSLQDSIDELGTDDLKKSIEDLTQTIETQGIEMRKLQEGEELNEQDLEKLIEDKATEITEVIKARAGQVRIALKTDVTRASVTNHTLAMRLGDVGQLAYNRTKLEGLFQSGSVGANSNGTIRYVDQTANTRNADWVAEAGQKPESAIIWQEYTLPIEVIADTIPVTIQAMTQVGFVASEIRNLLFRNLNLKIDQDLFDGSGVTPIIFGAYTRADTYTAAAAGITDANIYDLIVKVNEDITDTTQYEPNYALVSHADFSTMLLKKEATTNAYMSPPFASIIGPGGGVESGMMVNGILVIPSATVTTNTMLVGDFRFATLYNLGGVNLDMGWIDKQFIENMMTLRAERQLGMLIRTAHTDAFRKVTDVSAALVTLAT